jgi:hypothetical protein
MTDENKYSNSVRIIEELQNVAKSDNQKKELIKTSKKVAAAALGSVVLDTPVVSAIKNKIESKINKIPFSDNMLVGTNKIGLKLGDETYSSSFTVNKKGDANLKLSKSFTEDLKTELSADKDSVKVGLKLTF